MAGRPMITPPQLHDDGAEPFRSLMARAAAVEEREGVLSGGLLLVQPWIDVPGLGCKAVVTADGDQELAARVAEELAEELWRERRGFLAGRRPPPDEALEQALAGESPFVFADSGDATNGGSVGDSTELLRAVLRRGRDERVLLSVVAPAAAQAAHAAGEGASVEVELGTGPPGSYNEAVRLAARVERLYDGDLVYTHPVNAGYRGSTGPAALLRRGGLAVVAHTRSVGVIDPAIYVALGVQAAAFDVVQAKSHVSYKAGFEGVTPRSVVADTAGPTTGDLAKLDFRLRPRPLFPFELR
jgi:microcystin degradation protein MlrC